MSMEERVLLSAKSYRMQDLHVFQRELDRFRRQVCITKCCATTTSCLLCPLTSVLCLLPGLAAFYCCVWGNDTCYTSCLLKLRCTMWIRPPETCTELACTFCTPFGYEIMPDADAYYLLPPARQRMEDLVQKIDTLSREVWCDACSHSVDFLATFLPRQLTYLIFEYLDIDNFFTDTPWVRYYALTLCPE